MSSLPASVMDELRREFLADTQAMLESLEEQIIDLQGGEPAARQTALRKIYRRIHSLKGSGTMFGFPGLSHLCHDLEEFLEDIQRSDHSPGEEELALLSGIVVELGRALGDGPQAEQPRQGAAGWEEVEKYRLRLQRYLARRVRTSEAQAMLPDAGSPPPSGLPDWGDPIPCLSRLSEKEKAHVEELARLGYSFYLIEVCAPSHLLDEELSSFSAKILRPLEIVAFIRGGPRGEGTVAAFLVVGGPAASLESFGKEVPPLVAAIHSVAAEALLARSDRSGEGSQGLAGISGEAAAASGSLDGQRPDAPVLETEDSLAPGEVASTAQVKHSPLVRVRMSDLEDLAELAGEIRLAAGKVLHRLNETEAGDMPRSLRRDLVQESTQQARRIADLRRRVLALRMVPIRPVLTRFYAIAQSLAWESGKEVELHVSGEQTRVDRSVLEALGEPLLHLVRNAIDHGLEPPEVRLGQGKERRGNLWLEASCEGQQVTLQVTDDGRGVDREAVERRARERGLLVGPTPREEELWSYLFSPGFSTRDHATEISGRGVGLDVVRRSVLALEGMVEVSSTPRQGTRIVLRVPQTLTLTRGLVVAQGKSVFAFPSHSVVGVRGLRRAVHLPPPREAGQNSAHEELPLFDLGIFFATTSPGAAGDSSRCAIVTGVAERRLGVIVDRILGQEEMVVRPLGPQLARHPGLTGVAELANGHLALVVDISFLIENAHEAGMPSAQRSGTGPGNGR